VTTTPEAVTAALRPVQDPELHRSIVDLGMVAGIDIDGGRVRIAVDLTVPGCPLKAEINNRVVEAVTALDGVDEAVVEFGVMSDEQREAIRRQLHGDPAATAGSAGPAHGHAEGRAIPFADPDNRTRVILVASGKGGVGKSSVTTNLAVALADRGRSVAIVDADVWGFSIPRMLGVDRDPVVIDEMIVPPEANGVRCISMGFFVEENQPVIWRGPMLHKALEQFLTDVFWDDPDFLIVDLPPGTGDAQLTLSQKVPLSGAVIVTTPQDIALIDARKGLAMFEKVQVPVVGIVENMSTFVCPHCGQATDIFKRGGGERTAQKLGCAFLGRVPLDPAIVDGGDAGAPIVVSQPDGVHAEAFRAIAEAVVVQVSGRERGKISIF
jgi:ATP-binding protein involved in chromosome partitioning